MLCDTEFAALPSFTKVVCLNPCFSGICSVTDQELDWLQDKGGVSILVLVEYAL